MIQVYIVDAFHDGPATGNPAAVVFTEGVKEPGWMQSVAAELNQAATAFVGRAGNGRVPLRWYSPVVELPLCGHGTLAAAHVIAVRDGCASVDFDTTAGQLAAHVDGDVVTLDFPAPTVEFAAPPPGLLDALGVAAMTAATSGHMVIVEVETPDAVLRCRPDFAADAFNETRTAVVTSAGGIGAAITSRVFAPSAGIPEDHATGSAHCALAVFWADRLGTRLTCRQASPRGARIEVALEGGRVSLGGLATTVMEGTLTL